MKTEEDIDLYRCKHNIDRLYPTLATFTGELPIQLLSLFSTMKNALDTTGASEASGMRVITYLIEEKARDVHQEQPSSDSEDPEEELFERKTSCTWAHLVDALIRRFLSGDFLQTS